MMTMAEELFLGDACIRGELFVKYIGLRALEYTFLSSKAIEDVQSIE